MSEVLGVHEFRSTLPAIMRRLGQDEDDAVLVGPYRRPTAALIPISRYVRGLATTDTTAGRASSNLATIRSLLRQSPQQRLEGLVNACRFFGAAHRA